MTSQPRLTNVASNRRMKFHSDREFNIAKTWPHDNILCHHTREDGLKGVFENNGLWATSAYSLMICGDDLRIRRPL